MKNPRIGLPTQQEETYVEKPIYELTKRNIVNWHIVATRIDVALRGIKSNSI